MNTSTLGCCELTSRSCPQTWGTSGELSQACTTQGEICKKKQCLDYQDTFVIRDFTTKYIISSIPYQPYGLYTTGIHPITVISMTTIAWIQWNSQFRCNSTTQRFTVFVNCTITIIEQEFKKPKRKSCP